MWDIDPEARMVIDVLVVHGVRDEHGASTSRVVEEAALAEGLRAERVGVLDAAPGTLRALYMRTATLVDRTNVGSLAAAMLGSVGVAVRERLFRVLIDAIRARQPAVVVVTDPLARAVVEAVRADRIGFPRVIDASELPLAERAFHAVEELAVRGPHAPRRVLLAAADLPPEEIRCAIRSFTRVLGVALDVHTGHDEKRRAFAERELDVALVAGEASGARDPLAERLAACDLVIGRASPALVRASMAAGRPFLALPERLASEREAVAALLREEAGMRCTPDTVGALVAQSIDFARAARLGANGRRATRAFTFGSLVAPPGIAAAPLRAA
jgi:hypothetical protein